jgi:hypothetical protein
LNIDLITLSEQKFIANFARDAAHIMWFLGAGTSRSAGMPTATDLIWDLKRRYYCLQENQSISDHDISNKSIQSRVQAFFDGRGCPSLWSVEEYPYYFELNFGENYEAQQKYIFDQLAPIKVSTNIGHRALAALMGDGVTKVVFTTNFDEVIEIAFSEVTTRNLSAYHLEGAYAALNALNTERFPLYAKLHGDFRYTKIKNIEQDLIDNDTQIQKSFLAAATRYGVIVTGYSGRDANVMKMFHDALSQNNAFPQGLYWTVPRLADVADNVVELIREARDKGVSAHLVPTGTFDVMLSKLWKQTPHRDTSLDAKVRTAIAGPVNIALPSKGIGYPLLRTNALPVLQPPRKCGVVDYSGSITFSELNEALAEHKPDAILTYTDKVLFWGNEGEIKKALKADRIREIGTEEIDDPVSAIAASGFLKSFYEQALAKALCEGKPLLLRKRHKTFYLVVNYARSKDPVFSPLAQALAFKGKPAFLSGSVPRHSTAQWAEAVSIRLEEKGGRLWLLLRPEIWVNPLSERENTSQFIRQKRLYRYNNQSSAVLDAWIGILFDTVGKGAQASVSCYPDADFPVKFVVGTRTAYSHRGGVG